MRFVPLASASWLVLAAATGHAAGADAAAANATAVDFQSQIRPILATRCVKCHGRNDPDGGLNLGDENSAKSQLASGTRAVVPGDADHSELMRRITATDPDERMPAGGQPLAASEVELLRRWISAGATWPAHWAYAPLKRPVPPETPAAFAEWPRTPIDRFVLAELQRVGLAPSPEADRRTLIRRLSFDLIGLPPTMEDVEAFQRDDSPGAYEAVVDRLLASPRYGERSARHWLDLVHFAETHGHDQDRPREHAWPYRDYLIRAFNADKPYARFVQEQVAGDVLFPDDAEAIRATGLLAAGPWDESSLRDIREDSPDREVGRYLDRDDIVTTVMSTFVSTSVHCARCHDHKFDPVSQDDYYALQAVFAGVDKANREFEADPQVARRRSELLARQSQISQQLASNDPALLEPGLVAASQAWEDAVVKAAPVWNVLALAEPQSQAGAALTALDDGSLLSTGDRPERDVVSVVGRTGLKKVTALRLETLTDPSLPHQGPGRQDNGNFSLNELRVYVLAGGEPPEWRRIVLANPQADFNQAGWTVGMAIDDNPATGWSIYPDVGKPHQAVFEIPAAIEAAEGVTLKFELQQSHGMSHLIGRVRFSVAETAGPLPTEAVALPPDVAAVVATERLARTPTQQARLAAHYWQLQTARDLAALPPLDRVYCGTPRFQPEGSFRPTAKPRTVHVLQRGNIVQPLREAAPGALACVPGLPREFQLADATDEGARRAALARWLSDVNNVLTWRSIANRAWQHHFGRGLVDTPSDFGQMGTAPTHPELLDWLADTLRAGGGSLKSLHRLIVTSAVYRQSAADRPDQARLDADNLRLWRMNRRRLDAESFHDALLAASGTLDVTMGGPSARQFIQTPGVHVTPVVDYMNFDVNNPANFRRSVYRFVFRTLPDPLMETLDCPDASQLTPQRTVSVTPLQALATLNARFVLRQSELLAERIGKRAQDPAGQIDLAFQCLLARHPTAEEAALVGPFAVKHGLAYACRFLINLNEFMFVD